MKLIMDDTDKDSETERQGGGRDRYKKNEDMFITGTNPLRWSQTCTTSIY